MFAKHLVRKLPSLLILFALALSACSTGSSGEQAGAIPTPTTVINESIEAIVQPLYDQGSFSGSVLVARDGKIIHNNGYGYENKAQETPISHATRYRIASITKQFTAMAIMMLQEQGKLDVQDSICKHIPDCPDAWQDITLHHLLSQASGLPGEFPDFDAWKDQPSTPAELVERIKSLSMIGAPGSGFYYSDLGYMLLGYVIEQVSGSTYQDFVKLNIFDPLQMESTGFDQNPPGVATGYSSLWDEAELFDISNCYSACGLSTTTDDLYKWYQAVKADKLVSPKTREQILTPHNLLDQDWSYGYGWFLGKVDGHPEAGHAGYVPGFYTQIITFPEDDLAIIWLNNNEPPIDPFEPVKEIARTLFSE